MDYTSNGLGEALNNNAMQNPESELYSALFDPAQAAKNLLNLADDVEVEIPSIASSSLDGDSTVVTIQITFRDGAMLAFHMEQPWGETGIWVPASGSFENL